MRRGRNLFLSMLENFVRIRTYGLYAKHYARGLLLIGQVRWSLAGHTQTIDTLFMTLLRFKTVSIRTILYFQGHFEHMKISL